MNFPDVEAMVVEFLNVRVAPKVSTQVTKPRPDTFVRAWRTGGAATNRVLEEAQITVQAWAPTSVEASDLAQECRRLLLNDYTGMPLVRGVNEVSGVYFDPDPGTNIPRYTFTSALLVRAQR